MKKQKEKNKVELNKEQRIQALFDAKIISPSAIYRRIKNKVKISQRQVYRIIEKIKKDAPLTRKIRSDHRISQLNKYKARIIAFIKQQEYCDSNSIKKRFKLKLVVRTIQKWLKQNNIAVYDNYKKGPLISKKQEDCRKRFGRLHKNDDIEWAVFDDESKFQTFSFTQKTYRLADEDRKEQPQVKHPFKINAWIAIALHGKSQIHLFKENMDGTKYKEICTKFLIPFVKKHFKNKTAFLYQDNDPKHKMKDTQKVLKDCNIIRISDWPSNSPDINPVENVWGMIKKEVRKVNPKTEKELVKTIKKSWKNIQQSVIDKTIKSWKKRCQLLVKQKGKKIKY